ncbi:hypothetical protein EV401DRAFT_1225754 [Pisolithus croceorrhizus]|nr:hypothetical protein EV401DRAFT_1225754 [Pisolithus croceorrhizus]
MIGALPLSSTSEFSKDLQTHGIVEVEVEEDWTHDVLNVGSHYGLTQPCVPTICRLFVFHDLGSQHRSSTETPDQCGSFQSMKALRWSRPHRSLSEGILPASQPISCGEPRYGFHTYPSLGSSELPPQEISRIDYLRNGVVIFPPSSPHLEWITVQNRDTGAPPIKSSQNQSPGTLAMGALAKYRLRYSRAPETDRLVPPCHGYLRVLVRGLHPNLRSAHTNRNELLWLCRRTRI